MSPNGTSQVHKTLAIAKDHIALARAAAERGTVEESVAEGALKDIRAMLVDRLDRIERRLLALEARTLGSRAGI